MGLAYQRGEQRTALRDCSCPPITVVSVCGWQPLLPLLPPLLLLPLQCCPLLPLLSLLPPPHAATKRNAPTVGRSEQRSLEVHAADIASGAA